MKLPQWNPSKLQTLVAGLILLFTAHAGLLFIAIKNSDPFRSQNILYHLGLAEFYLKGDFALKSFSALPHSIWGGSFLDQHKVYGLFLAGLRSFTGPETAATLISALSIALALTAMILLWRKKWPEASVARTGPVEVLTTFLALPLVFLYISESFFVRWMSGRPNSLHFAFLVFMLWIAETAKKPSWTKEDLLSSVGGIFALSFLWAGLSYFSLLGPPLLILVFVVTSMSLWRRALVLAVASLSGVLAGFFFSSGPRFFQYSFELIYKHLIQNSGIYEWMPPGGRFHFVPLLISILALILATHQALRFERESRPRLAELYFYPITALFFSLCTLQFARLIDLAWPFAILALGLARPALKDMPSPRWRGPAILLAAALVVGLQVSRFSQRPLSDGSLHPEAMSLIAEVQHKFPDQRVIISDWTAWSAAFFMDPHTKMEPGFSMGLYPEHLKRLYSQLLSPTGNMNLDEVSHLIEGFQTDLVLLRSVQAERLDVPKEELMIRHGYSLLRVFPRRPWTPAPAQQTLCQSRPRYIQLLVFDSEFQLRRQTPPRALGTELPCETAITQLQGKRMESEYRILRSWSDPRPLRDLRQLQTPETLGHFGFESDNHLTPSEVLRLTSQYAPPSNAQSLREDLVLLDEAPFELRDRLIYFKNPNHKLVCQVYQNGLRALLKRSDSIFEVLTIKKDHSQRVRNVITAATLCARPQLAPLDIATGLKDFCNRAFSKIDEYATTQFTLEQGFVPSEAILFDLYSKAGVPSLRDLQPRFFLRNGRTSSFIFAKDQDPMTIERMRVADPEIFSSGQLAVWWARRRAEVDRSDFEAYIKNYEKLYRTEYNFNIFMLRWWSEALTQHFQQTQSPTASHWMEQFFRATETMVKGPSKEPFTGCLGPQVPGLPALALPNHNSGLLMEGLEQARRANFPWWSDKEELLLEGLLRCTLALQARTPFWPSERQGEFLWSPGEEVWRPDVQAHLLNALGQRLENYQVSCNP